MQIDYVQAEATDVDPTGRHSQRLRPPDLNERFVEITFRTDRDLEGIASDFDQTVLAILSACEDRERYHTFANLVPVRADRAENRNLYRIYMLHDLSRLMRREDNGEGKRGWDSQVIAEQGLCMKLSGGNPGVLMITSNTERLPVEVVNYLR